MSHTDKDLPAWVRNAQVGRIEHDHTTGVCIEDSLGYARRRYTGGLLGSRHRSRCAKRVEVHSTCTKADPATDRYGRRTCWRAYYTTENADGADLRWVTTGCGGHVRVVWDEDRPCSCDDVPPAPTCTFDWVYGRYCIDYVSISHEDRRAAWYGPERARERVSLAAMAREYNTYGDLDDDGDFEPRPHRRSVRAWWW